MTNAYFGNVALAVAILASGGSILAAVFGARWGSPTMLRVMRWAIHLTTTGLTFGCAVLLGAILNDDFSLKYVAGYSELALPWAYKLAAFWAGQQGSLLLWAWMVALMSSIAVAMGRKDPATTQAPVAGLLGGGCGFFTIIMLFAANPFELGIVTPADGLGLNPLLQHPAMIAHPPFLFLGYAGFTIPFATILGVLIAGRADNDWVGRVRKWVLSSWMFLTVGIVLGAWWAYVELGWGGYWGWDPVENASLLPWFTGTAMLHSLVSQQQRGMLKIWNAVLAGLTFILCIFGTYLTRSGIIASVHAFSESSIGQFFLVMIALCTGIWVGVILWRRRGLGSERTLEKIFSREGAFIALSSLLLAMMIATLIGTMLPVLTKPFSGESITVGKEFYNHVVVPMGLALILLMGAAPLLRFFPARGLRRRLILPLTVTCAAIILAAVFSEPNWWTVSCAAIGAFGVTCLAEDFVRSILTRLKGRPRGVVVTIAHTLRVNSHRYGGQLAHLGMIMVLAGAAGSGIYGFEQTLSMKQGETADIGRYTLRYDSFDHLEEGNYIASQATLALLESDGRESMLRPQRRIYNRDNRGTPMSEVAVRSNLRDDVYLSLAGWTNYGETVHIDALINPLMAWMWIGGATMTLGALVCLLAHPGSRRVPIANIDSQFRPEERIQ